MYGIQGCHLLRHFEENSVSDMEQLKTSTSNIWHVRGTFPSFTCTPQLTKPSAWAQYRADRACLRSATQECTTHRWTLIPEKPEYVSGTQMSD